MRNPPPSGGKLSLAFKCLGSNVLPQVKEVDPGPEAEEGKRKHAVLEKYFEAGRVHQEETGEADRKTCELVARAIGPTPSLGERPELAVYVQALAGISDTRRPDHNGESGQTHSLGTGDLVAVDGRDSVGADGSVHAGRTGHSDVEPPKLVRSNSFVAIADLIGFESELHASVWDWKTGGWVPEAKWNWQLLLPAIGLWLASGCHSDFICDIGIVYAAKLDELVRSTLQIPDSERDLVSAVDSYRCTAAFLADRLEQLRGLERRLIDADPASVTLYEGKHCFFCPAASRCPAKIGALGNALLAIGQDVNDLELIKNYLALSETWTSKTATKALERNGNQMNLGDGRIAVLNTEGRKKIYTRKANEQERSDAPEDG